MRLTSLTVLVGALLLGAAGCADPSANSEEVPRGDRGSTGVAAEAGEHGDGSVSSGTGPGHGAMNGDEVAPAIEPDPTPGEARIQPGEPLPPERVDASTLPRNYPRKVNVTSGGEVLAVVARESGCGRAAVEIVQQTPRRVVLLLTESVPQGAASCDAEVRMPTVSVRLDEPLGNRTVELRFEDR